MKTPATLLIALMASQSMIAQTQPGKNSLTYAEQRALTGSGADPDSLPGSGSTPRPLFSASSPSDKALAAIAFENAMVSVLSDFPNNLHNITGGLMLAEGEVENYASTITLPGAQTCIITRYHSVVDTSASWQAKMYSNEDFKKAAFEYHELYKKLQACYLISADGIILYLKGEWEPAREEIRFTTSSLRFGAGDPRYRDLAVELELVYLLDEWVVNINVISKPPDELIN